jgi:hypothetical protein
MATDWHFFGMDASSLLRTHIRLDEQPPVRSLIGAHCELHDCIEPVSIYWMFLHVVILSRMIYIVKCHHC